MKTTEERLAVLEERAQTNEEQNTQILKELGTIKGDLNKYRGFIGAIAFLVSCVGIFFSGLRFFKGG